jgi:hypothetical protein
MSEMHSELVALEETQLENVAGGLDRSRLKKFTVQVNKVEIDNSVFQAGGDINISQSND